MNEDEQKCGSCMFWYRGPLDTTATGAKADWGHCDAPVPLNIIYGVGSRMTLGTLMHKEFGGTCACYVWGTHERTLDEHLAPVTIQKLGRI